MQVHTKMHSSLDYDKDLFSSVLILGSLEKLRNTETISSLNVEKKIPCNRLAISAWEQSNGIHLPSDLREYYASTDGTNITWKNEVTEFKGHTISIRSEIKVSSLTGLHRLHFVNQRKSINQHSNFSRDRISTNEQNKEIIQNKNTLDVKDAFILSHHQNVGSVCITFFHSHQPQHECAFNPKDNNITSSIWLLDTANCWHFLADNFSKYFRMMLVHLGLEYWQLKFTTIGLTPRMQKIMAILIPDVAQSQTWKDTRCSIPRNVINTNLFKVINPTTKTLKTKPTRKESSLTRNKTKNRKL